MLSKMSNRCDGDGTKRKKEEEEEQRKKEKLVRLRARIQDELNELDCYIGDVSEKDVEAFLSQKGDFIMRTQVNEYLSISTNRNEFIGWKIYATINSKYGILSLPLRANEVTTGTISFSFDMKTRASTIKDLLLEHVSGRSFAYDFVPHSINQRKLPRTCRSLSIRLLNPRKKQEWETFPTYGIPKKSLEKGADGEAWKIDQGTIELMKKLGEGAFGEVHLGTMKMRAERRVFYVAIKVIKKTTNNEKAITEIQKEGALLRMFNHKNVVNTYGMVIGQDNIMVVMELINGGGLNDYVLMNKVSIEEKKSYAIDIANGLAYIHSLNCIHRDIASRNCFVDKSRKVAKVGDMESTRQTEIYKIWPNERLSVRWTAPEVLTSYEYNRAADIYAYGILVWEIFADGAIPFGIMTNRQIKEGIQGTLRPEWPSGTPTEVIEIINSCWSGDAASRPQLSGIKSKIRTNRNWNVREMDYAPRDIGRLSPPPFQVNDLLSRILKVGAPGGRLTQSISEKDVMMCCLEVKAVFASQSSLLEMDPPVVVCGNIHGQYVDLLRIFDKEGFPPNSNYLFLGDYVDRGQQNIETIILLFCYKIKYPNNFFMLRGNHECPSINRVYGFYEECNRRYKSTRLWQYFIDVFNWMPLTALIGGRILSMHGGLSPRLNSLTHLRKISRPQDPPNTSMEFDLMWSDPDLWIKGWQVNTRGASYVFGQDVVMGMCETLGIDMIARAHQVVQDGYEFFAGRRLVTIFSVPNYCGQFENNGATMRVDDEMRCTFVTYKGTFKSVRREMQQDGVDTTQEE